MTRNVRLAPAPEPAELTAARHRFVALSVMLAVAAGAAAGLLSTKLGL